MHARTNAHAHTHTHAHTRTHAHTHTHTSDIIVLRERGSDRVRVSRIRGDEEDGRSDGETEGGREGGEIIEGL